MSIPKENEKAMQLVTKDESDWVLMQRQCAAFLKSQLLPTHIKTLEQAVTIAWKGREMNLPPLYSLSNISVINGKPCLSAELMLALIYRNIPGSAAVFTTPPEKQHLECEAVVNRPNGATMKFRFSIEDAKRAGIYRQTWEKYPAALLRARTISSFARAVFPDALMGCSYTPEEMGDDSYIEAEFEVAPKQEKQLEPQKQETITPPKTPPETPHGYTGPLSEAQKKRMYAIGKANGFTAQHVKDLVKGNFHKEHFIDLTRNEYDVICNLMQENPRIPETPDNYSSEAPH